MRDDKTECQYYKKKKKVLHKEIQVWEKVSDELNTSRMQNKIFDDEEQMK